MRLDSFTAQQRRLLISGDYRLWAHLQLDETGCVYAKAKVTFHLYQSGPVFLDFLGTLGEWSCSLDFKEQDGGFLISGVEGLNEVEFTYTLKASQDGMGLMFLTPLEEGRALYYTNFVPQMARRVFPLFDQPDIRCRFSLELDVPDWMEAVSNYPVAMLGETDGRRHFRFEETAPLASYLLHFTAGDLVRVELKGGSVPMSVYVRPCKQAHLPVGEITDLITECMDWYVHQFDCAFPFPKYDQIFLPQFYWGGMENAGAVALREEVLFEHEPDESQRMDRDNLLAHELSHMWFGDLVTMVWWDDLWLNEAFATYITSRVLKDTGRWPDAMSWLRVDVAIRALNEDALDSTHPVLNPVPYADEAFLYFDAITYQKGAALLSTLAENLQEEFFLGIRQYFARFRFSNTTRDDFFACMPASAMTDSIQEALGRTGAPRLIGDGHSVRFEKGGGIQALKLMNQNQSRVDLSDTESFQAGVYGGSECQWFRPVFNQEFLEISLNRCVDRVDLRVEILLGAYEGLLDRSLSLAEYMDFVQRLVLFQEQPAFGLLCSQLSDLCQRSALSQSMKKALYETLKTSDALTPEAVGLLILLCPDERMRELLEERYDLADTRLKRQILIRCASAVDVSHQLLEDFPDIQSDENRVLKRICGLRVLSQTERAFQAEALIEESISTVLKGRLLPHVFATGSGQKIRKIWIDGLKNDLLLEDEALMGFWVRVGQNLSFSKTEQEELHLMMRDTTSSLANRLLRLLSWNQRLDRVL